MTDDAEFEMALQESIDEAISEIGDEVLKMSWFSSWSDTSRNWTPEIVI